MALSRGEIDGAYFTKVEALHPDAQVGRATDGDVGSEEANLAVLNQARSTLADPQKRAEALLAVLSPEAARAEIHLAPAFLMEIMEVREAVDAAAESGDAAERARWQQWGKDQRQELIQSVTQAFVEQEFRHVRSLLNQWRYVERLMEALRHTGNQN